MHPKTATLIIIHCQGTEISNSTTPPFITSMENIISQIKQ